MPLILRRHAHDPLFVAACSPPDRHGYVSLGTNADYVTRFIGQARFFVEVNPQMPRTFGENTLHLSQVIGWTVADYPLVEVPPREPSDKDRVIAELVAERIPDGATIQAGIGAIPDSILHLLHDHRDLGLHTELISDGVMDLMESGAVNGTRKVTRPRKAVGTFALGTHRLYEFLDDNSALQFLPVDWVNDPRRDRTRAALRLDQRDGRGRPPRPVQLRDDQRPLLLRQRRPDRLRPGGHVQRARPGLRRAALHHERRERVAHRHPAPPGAPVTTMKNTVDHVVTEHGIAQLHGRSMTDRAAALIGIAHPKFRDELTAEATKLGYLR